MASLAGWWVCAQLLVGQAGPGQAPVQLGQRHFLDAVLVDAVPAACSAALLLLTAAAAAVPASFPAALHGCTLAAHADEHLLTADPR